MDGYAVRDADLEQLPASLPLIGESFAGAGCQTAIRPGTSIRIFTGAPVPPGADRVVVQEMVQREGGNAIISGSGGTPNAAYQLLTSQNVALPVAEWTQIGTGNFTGTGAFSITNAINPETSQAFFLILQP